MRDQFFKSVVAEIVPCPYCKGTGAMEKKRYTRSAAWAEAIRRRTGKWPRGYTPTSAREENADE